MSEWQPIETAPKGKDHPYAKFLEAKPATFVLVWNGFHMGVGYCDAFADWWSETGEPIEPPPTHWMPLPDPPEAA